MTKKIRIVPKSVFYLLEGRGISKKKLENLLLGVTHDLIDNKMAIGKTGESDNRVNKLVAVVQYLWNENIDLKERIKLLLPAEVKKTPTKKQNTKCNFKCVKCGEWYPHSKVEVWDENPSVIRYICHRCQEEEEI